MFALLYQIVMFIVLLASVSFFTGLHQHGALFEYTKVNEVSHEETMVYSHY